MENRNNYIGGTDCAGILGMSRWSSPLQVWALKTGAIKEEDISGKLAVRLGNMLEQTVAELFMEETGKRVYRVNETIYHTKHRFLGANIDRRIVGEDAGLECKTASAWKAKEWEGEEIPREYELQCHHYLAVTGRSRWYLAVLIGNQDFKMKVIERDEKLIREIIKKEVDFWKNYVEKKVAPEIITKQDRGTLEALYPQAEPETEVPLDADADAIVDELGMFKQDKKHLEGLIEQHENKLKSLIKENEKGVTPKQAVVKWSNSKWSGIDQKALKEEMPDIYERFHVDRPTRRFTYKTVK